MASGVVNNDPVAARPGLQAGAPPEDRPMSDQPPTETPESADRPVTLRELRVLIRERAREAAALAELGGTGKAAH